jgi:Ca2+-binding RTX toxin-like protein
VRRTLVLFTTMALTLLVASGVALAVTKIGTDGPDTLRGTNGDDNLLGKGANDVLYALGGRDNLLGAEGKDWLFGGDERRALGGNKNLVGGPGNDGMFGGTSPDTVLGGSGNDYVDGDKGSDRAVVGGEGRDLINGWKGSDRMLGEGGGDWLIDDGYREFSKDVLSGGSGNDVIDAWHKPAAVQDVVTCGSGFDQVISDRADMVAPDCENVVVVHGSLEDSFRQHNRFVASLPPATKEFFDAENDFANFFEVQLAPFPAG